MRKVHSMCTMTKILEYAREHEDKLLSWMYRIHKTSGHSTTESQHIPKNEGN